MVFLSSSLMYINFKNKFSQNLCFQMYPDKWFSQKDSAYKSQTFSKASPFVFNWTKNIIQVWNNSIVYVNVFLIKKSLDNFIFLQQQLNENDFKTLKLTTIFFVPIYRCPMYICRSTQSKGSIIVPLILVTFISIWKAFQFEKHSYITKERDWNRAHTINLLTLTIWIIHAVCAHYAFLLWNAMEYPAFTN